MNKKQYKDKVLILIESPGKQKTIESFLKDEDKEYIIRASFGHIMEMSTKRGSGGLGVDLTIESSYKIYKSLIQKNKDKLTAILAASKGVKEILLATDPDREGETISQDLYDCLESVGVPMYRIRFGEITKAAILKAIKNKTNIDSNLVDAQKSRMVLDRIIGFMASTWLEKVFKGKENKEVYSAGRVQSPAVRLIIDREEEIEKFIPEEYWNIFANLAKNKTSEVFKAKLIKKILNENDAKNIKIDLEKDIFNIINVDAKEKSRPPLPPLITSSLQQVAGAKFGLNADQTMKIAQILYEKSHISYMRTDSIRSSPESIEELRAYLKDNKYDIPNKPNLFSNKSNVQDGHEAIRVTHIENHPDNIFFEDANQKKIYRLIWERFVASQMLPALYDTVTILIKSSSSHELKAIGKTLKYAGWLSVSSDQTSDDEGDLLLPILNSGDKVILVEPKVKLEQKFTQPPPRYSEGNLIKELEKKGIGRPSTFANVVTKIRDRDYIEFKNKTYQGTDKGKKVIDKIKDYFSFIEYDYTANMEEKLDLVAEGKLKYVDLIDSFFKHFQKDLKLAYNDLNEASRTEIQCSKCQVNTMLIKHGPYGYYLSCADLDCKNNISCEVDGEGKPIIKQNKQVELGISCPKCNGAMTKKDGKFGPYYACLDFKCGGKGKVPYGKQCPLCKDQLFLTIYGDDSVLFCMGYAKTGCSYKENLPPKEQIVNPKNYNSGDGLPKNIKRILKKSNKKS